MTTPALVAATQWSVATGFGGTCTGIVTTGATDIFVCLACQFSDLTVTDNYGNTWTKLVETTAPFGVNYIQVWQCTPPSGSFRGTGHTFTWSSGNNRTVGACVGAYSGTDVSDATPAITTGSFSGSSRTPSITTATDGDLVLCFGATNAAGTTFGIDTGFSIDAQQNTNLSNFLASVVQTTHGTISPTVTFNQSFDVYVMVALKAAAGGGAVGRTLFLLTDYTGGMNSRLN